MAKVSKAQMIIDIMNANPTMVMDEVLALIVAAAKDLPGAPIDTSRAKAYYVYNYRKGIAAGVGPGSASRKVTTKAAKAPKAPKATKVRVPAPRIAGDKEKAGIDKNLTVEEINDIRAKNMARLKAVGQKYAKGQYAEPRVSDEPFDPNAVSNLEAELDSFQAPKFLKLDQVKALV
jgi:hypothetical protein